MDDALSVYGEAVDKYTKGAATFDLELLKEVTTDDYLWWVNTARMDRRALTLEEVYDELYRDEQEQGFNVTVRDKRRRVAGNALIQQDIATVTRGNESFEFARCHVFEFEGNKIRRKWEYYDSGSTRKWAVSPAPLEVPD
jgi:ketosteroid isomerase-like protein